MELGNPNETLHLAQHRGLLRLATWTHGLRGVLRNNAGPRGQPLFKIKELPQSFEALKCALKVEDQKLNPDVLQLENNNRSMPAVNCGVDPTP